jgi:ubiquinol-cytochrome c reductase iron-sulfur subunit
VYSESRLAAKQRRATVLVVCAFAVALAAGVGFVFAYWMGADNLLLGSTLAVFLGGFGFALVMYSHSLMSQKEATEPREVLPSSPAEREAFRENFCAAAGEVQRRSLLMWMGAAGMGLIAAIVLSLMRSLGMSPYPSLFSTVWKPGQRLVTSDGKPVTVNSLRTGSATTVFPEGNVGSEDGQTMLIRVQEHLLRLPDERSTWAPMGYVAYSRVCTHAGCPVALFESGTNILLCPCHQSTFDVLRAAKPTGGPAARPLPQLPLYVDGDGNLRASGGFTAPPGPGFWGTT